MSPANENAPILRCPFCGADGSMVRWEREAVRPHFSVACDDKRCGAHQAWSDDEATAISRWNKREGWPAVARKDEMQDEDPFPFGKYRNFPFKRVPAAYLLWLTEQDWAKKYPTVLRYIERSRTCLEKEVAEKETKRKGR